MLLQNKSIIINRLRFTLTFDDDTIKDIEVKTNDIVDVTFNNKGVKDRITGKIIKIGCNFNSSIGRVDSSAYMMIDGSEKYSGMKQYISPNNVIDIIVIETSDSIVNPVTSVSNVDQKIVSIRKDELGDFSYTIDGTTWFAVRTTGEQGLSAYEVAVKLGFEGTEIQWINSLNGADGKSAYEIAMENGFEGSEDEWLNSLVGPKGDAIYPKSVFNSLEELYSAADLIPANEIVCVVEDGNVGTLYKKKDNQIRSRYSLYNEDPSDKFDFLSIVAQGPMGPVGPKGDKGEQGIQGKDGKSTYEIAVENGYTGTEQEWLASLVGPQGQRGPAGIPGINGKSAYEIAMENGFYGTEQEWLASLKGEQGEKGLRGEKGDPGKIGKSAYEIAVENGYDKSEIEWLASLKGQQGPIGKKGEQGIPGKSAYEIAVENGFEGSEDEWMNTLVGPAGPKGDPGAEGPMGVGADWNAIIGQPGYIDNKPDISGYESKFAEIDEKINNIVKNMYTVLQQAERQEDINEIDKEVIY